MTTTTYFAGNEDTSFSIYKGPSYNYGPTSGAGPLGAALFRSAYVRGCITIGADGSTKFPPSRVCPPNMFASPLTTLWIHGWTYYDTPTSSNNGRVILGAADSSGIVRIGIEHTATLGQIVLNKYDSSGNPTLLGTSAIGIFQGLVLLPVDIFINWSVTGSCIVCVGGIPIISFTGDTTSVGASGISTVYWYNGTVGNCYWSEFLVQSTDTRGKIICTNPPLVNGNTNTWIGNVGNINKFIINDATFNVTTSANQAEQYTVTDNIPAGSYSVDALVVEARVVVGSTGPQNFEWDTRTADGSDHASTAGPPTNYFDNYSTIIPLNPHTSSAWATSDFGTGFNIGIESLT